MDDQNAIEARQQHRALMSNLMDLADRAKHLLEVVTDITSEMQKTLDLAPRPQQTSPGLVGILQRFIQAKPPGPVTDILHGGIWDSGDGRYHFQLSPLATFALAQGMEVDWATIRRAIKALGGERGQLNIASTSRSCWWVRSESLLTLQTVEAPSDAP